MNDCPENGQSLTKIYWFFETKIINFNFFQNFDRKSSIFRSNLNHWRSGNFFELLHASLAQKLTNLEFSLLHFIKKDNTCKDCNVEFRFKGLVRYHICDGSEKTRWKWFYFWRFLENNSSTYRVFHVALTDFEALFCMEKTCLL